ncbi:hypothetical protein KGF56_002953 [Candida oxycetoniae]|uniref:Uncharacterized protein n=1 Tax=Candida oxycetoniae TaxID=497107 RepID=A0AAI9SWR1_9ASCO|nr:uncharacterized protein KGF56_002953 [Candida oxycetoniae]KAI3404192.2 hypothetical protein KGF56_002953 [Candida oxycetoniae]
MVYSAKPKISNPTELILLEESSKTETFRKLEQQRKMKAKPYMMYKPYQFYHHYHYGSLITILSNGEMCFYYAITISLFLLASYYVIWVLPIAVLRSSEKIYYYLTGHRMSFNVLGLINSVFAKSNRGNGTNPILLSISEIPKRIN